MRTEQQMASIVARKAKELHAELSGKWGVPLRVIAGATMGLAITMMVESGYGEEEIVEVVRGIFADLSPGTPGTGGVV